MRSICKKGSATLVAVLALCVVASASASASQFYVGGKALTGTAKLAKTVKLEEPITLSWTWGSDHVVVTCTAASLGTGTKTVIEAPGTIKIEEVEFQGCSMTGLSGCSMEKEFGFEPIEAQLSTATSPEDSALVKTKRANGYFTLLDFKGTCAFSGETNGIFGKFALKLAKGQTESAEQEFVGEGEASKELEMVGWGQPDPLIYVKGKLKLKLESGSAWSYH